MIEYLKQLTEEQRWGKVLSYAERLTKDSDRTANELVVIYCSVLRARLELGEYPGALAAGEVVTKLAPEIEDWESFGAACNNIGVVHMILKQYEQARHYFQEYLTNAHRFNQDPERTSNVWYNFALALKALGRATDAIEALTGALEHASMTGNHRRVNALTLTLVDACLKAGEMKPIPRLLARSGRYFRSLPASSTVESLLYHLTYRTEFALLTGRLFRTRALALRGLSLAVGRPRHEFSFHLLLAKAARASMWEAEALDHVWAARSCAIACQRPDLEADATAFLEELGRESATST